MEGERDFWLKGSEAVSRFMEGVAAAQHRLNKGYETQSALECIVLSAAIVDALLRIGIILKAQLDHRTNDVDEQLLRQGDHDKIITERTVIDRAESNGVVSKSLADDLRSLYEARNRCIHRYVISDVNYTYATNLVFAYANVVEKTRREVRSLEEQQHSQGIGLVHSEADTAEPAYDAGIKEWYAEMIKAKEARGRRDR
jgi:hypothetical protein